MKTREEDDNSNIKIIDSDDGFYAPYKTRGSLIIY